MFCVKGGMKRNVWIIVAVLLLAGCGRTATVTGLDIVPEPVFKLQKEGSFTLNHSVSVAVSGLGQNSPVVKHILKSLRQAHFRPTLVGPSEECDLVLMINDTANDEIGKEGYLLEIRSTGIRLSANTETGLFYAYQTLLQLAPPDIISTRYRHIIFPECTILDYPRFEWRAVHLDVCRNFFPVKFVKKYLDLMAAYKMNRFQWHLADIHANRLPREDDSDEQCYTAEEIAEVTAYAADLGITVVPEVEYSDSSCISADEIIHVLTQLFPSPYIQIIGDDASEEELHALADSLIAQGKTPLGWDNGIIVACPSDYCYLDCYQADPRYQPAAIGGLITLAKAYQFDPIPKGTNRYVADRIAGGRCELWTEYITSPSDAEYMLLPRMLAISESLWSPRESKSWQRFRKNVEDQKERLTAKGYNYCDGSFTPHFHVTPVNENTVNVAIETEVPNTYIFYTTDLTLPTRQSAIYLGPVNLRRGTHIKILPVYNDTERDSIYEFIIK